MARAGCGAMPETTQDEQSQGEESQGEAWKGRDA